ncbi:MAG: hypothetical protein SFU56_05600 [Capsulimonadales bacterium]|nr:hypothetical protein [Capsulimonadales bacterium]
MAFDPKRHVIKVQGGREYLPVSARLVWFRSEHPDWGIVTQAVEINLEKQYAIFSCTIFNEEGRVMATATKMENVKGFGDYLEKAETGAVGRALAMCGYGTAFAPELEDGARFTGASARYPTRQNAAPPVRPEPPAPRPSASSRPAPEPEEEYSPLPARSPQQTPAAPARPVERPVERPTERSSDRPTANVAITRVREPERDLPDPGGEDEDEEDPFGDEETPLPAPSTRRPAVSEAAAAPNRPEPRPETRPEPAEGAPDKERNSLPRCSVEGCSNVLTSGQFTMSQQKFGRPICLMHQRDPAVVGATNGARRNPL